MRLVYFTDSHISYKGFSSRKDDYVSSIKNKLIEIIKVAIKINADYIVCGGDLFESPLPTPNSIMVANDIAKIFNSCKIPIYVVPGNHDEFGYNTKTLNKTLLGTYIANKTVKVLDRNNPLIHKQNGKVIAIEGQEYYEGIDSGDTENFTCKEKGDYHLLVIHAMLAKAKVLSHYKKNNVNCIDIEEVNSNANIVLAGHEHNGFGVTKINDTTFINPGSLARTSRDLTHEPSCVLIDINNDLKENIKLYKLTSALKLEDIFDNEAYNEVKDSNMVLEQFKKEVTEITNTKTTYDLKSTIDSQIEAFLRETEEKFDKNQYKEIADIIYKYIQISDEESIENKHISKNYKLRIKEVEIKNFQSHKHTILNFDELINVICGESDCGKSAIIRAIMLCLYNVPKGNEYIRTGTKECEVKVTFSDNSYIQRTRSIKSTGTYTVCTADGEIKTFDSFSNNLPIDLANEHQMPFVTIAKGVESNINISEQLDGPFLLRESSSVKASAIGKITKTDKVDLAIKNISSDVKSMQKEQKIYQKQIDEYKNELLAYEDLDKEKEFINNLEKLFNQYNNNKQQINTIKLYIDKLSNIDNKIKFYQEYFKNIKDFDNIRKNIDNVNKNILDINNVLTLSNKYNDICSKMNTIECYLNNTKDFEGISKNIDLLKKNTNNLINLNNYLGLLQDKYNGMKNANDIATNIKKKAESISKEKNKLNLELDTLLNTLSICPTCGSNITDECKEYMKK